MELKSLSKVHQEHPSFAPQWQRTEGDVIAENPRFGSLWHGVVCSDDGSPQYDLPVWLEPLGAVCVPLTASSQIALLEQLRPVPQAADHESRWPPTDLSGYGRISWELPRGFPNLGETPEQAARREAEEELGWIVQSVEYLGDCNANTTYCRNTQAVYLLRVDPNQPSATKPDKMETIQRVRVFSWEEILRMTVDGRIFCGFTKAALFSYHAYRAVHSNATL